MKVPPGPGTVVGTREVVIVARLLLVCMSQPVAADGGVEEGPGGKVCGGPPVSKLGFSARLVLANANGGHCRAAAPSMACTVELLICTRVAGWLDPSAIGSVDRWLSEQPRTIRAPSETSPPIRQALPSRACVMV